MCSSLLCLNTLFSESDSILLCSLNRMYFVLTEADTVILKDIQHISIQFKSINQRYIIGLRFVIRWWFGERRRSGMIFWQRRVGREQRLFVEAFSFEFWRVLYGHDDRLAYWAWTFITKMFKSTLKTAITMPTCTAHTNKNRC